MNKCDKTVKHFIMQGEREERRGYFVEIDY